jgi:hypothetical protein
VPSGDDAFRRTRREHHDEAIPVDREHLHDAARRDLARELEGTNYFDLRAMPFAGSA